MRTNEKLSEGPVALLTIKDVCEFLRCHPSTVYRFMKSGELPYVRVGSHRRFRMEDLEAYLLRAENTRQSA